MQSKEKEDRYVANYKVRPVLDVRSSSAEDVGLRKQVNTGLFVFFVV